MSIASFSFSPTPIPLGRQPYQIVVQRYDGKGNYQFLPNVYCLSVSKREGEPGSARFRYVLSDLPNSLYPDGFEDLIGVNAISPYAVKVDDRLVVQAISPDTGDTLLIFDGFAQEPEVALQPNGQQVTFSATGVAIRAWDTPLSGALQRHADDPVNGDVIITDLPVRFNPSDSKGLARPNATPLGADFGGFGLPIAPGGNGSFPVFLEPLLDLASTEDADEEDDEDQADSGDTRRSWTLGMIAKMLLWTPSDNGGNGDQQYVRNLDTTTLEAKLRAIAPVSGQTMDPSNPATYTAMDIIARDGDASNKDWPVALKESIWPYGFRYRFFLDQDGDGNPITSIKFYRRDGLFGQKPKWLSLQPSPNDLDPGQSNIASMHLNRSRVTRNWVVIETDPVLYEISVILAPLFTINSADGTMPGGPKPFDKSNWGIDFAGNQADKRSYRLFGIDECGDGHWKLNSSAWTTAPFDNSSNGFNPIFDPSSQSLAGQDFVYTRRYRPGRNELLSTHNATPLGEPLRSQLHVSKDYAGLAPSVWDNSGTWQLVSGGWRLLRTRLGIYIDVDNPNAWNIGNPPADSTKDKIGSHGKLNLVECLATPSAQHPLVYLRLTTVIASDKGIGVQAPARAASSTRFNLTTRVDARDHYKKQVIDVSSPFNASGGTAKAAQIVPRDDTAKAQAYADSLRAAGEQGHWQGSVTIPRFTTAYDVSDRVSGITGRTASFQTNAGGQQGEGPTYPMITGVTWDFDGKQTTTLEFSNAIDEPMRPK